MNRMIVAITAVLTIALICVPNAKASAFMTINVGATQVTCNNATAAGVTACFAAGFNTALNSGAISFTGTVVGYTFGGGGATGIDLVSNPPGTPSLADTLLTLTALSHVSGNDALVIDYGVNNFTAPVGPDTLSAVSSGTMSTGLSGTAAFRSWERNDNALAAGPIGATAVSIAGPCTFPAAAPPAQTCSGPTLTLGSPGVTAPFALTSSLMITTPTGFLGSFTTTTDLSPTPITTPEPSSLLLLGSGLLVGARQLRKRPK